MRRFTLLHTTAFSLLFIAISCNKEEGFTPESNMEGQVDICISGDFNDFDTKASIENIFRMTWTQNDKVYVYGKASGSDAFSNLGTLEAVPDATTGNRVADLKGSINAPKPDTKLTLVYSPLRKSAPSVSNGAISFNLDNQSGMANDVTFVAYTTVDYKGATDATYRTSFSFATSVLRVNVTDLSPSTELNKVAIGPIETRCKLTLATDAAPTVDGYWSGTIYKTLNGCSSNAKGYAAFYIAVPAITENADRRLTITQAGNEYDADGFAAGQKPAGNMMNSIAKLLTTGQRGVLNGQEYVVIRGSDGKYLKWATQNIAVTESGKKECGNTGFVIGDFFQWAASYAGYNITSDADKVPANLVIYNSFTNNCTGGSGNSFSFKSGKSFVQASAPYSNSGSYIKYTSSSETLDLTDDVANIVLGSTWRMPTGGANGQFAKMREATYWAWDAANHGYYVFKPGLGTSGTSGGRGIIGNDDKTKALLFFPAAGYGLNTILHEGGTNGHYWAGVNSSTEYAYMMYLNSGCIVTDNDYSRFHGFSIRPISD